MNDTPPHIEKLLKQKFAAFSGEQRLIMGCKMHSVARDLVLSSLSSELPRREKRQQYFKRFYSKDLSPAFFSKVLEQL